MAQVFYIQLHNVPQACRIAADKIESSEGQLLLKDAKGELIGQFNTGAVMGWWKKSAADD